MAVVAADGRAPYVAAAVLLGVLAGSDLARFGLTEDALLMFTRHTARLAFLFYFVTFTASVWFTWRITPVTAWLMRRRRHLGLSFALVHFVHLASLTTLFSVRGEAPEAVVLVFGGLAYVLLLMMVLTSSNAARRRLGRRWRTLHLTGCWYLWVIFTQSYLGRLDPAAGAEPYPAFLLLTAMALAIPLLRTWAWARRRARRTPGVSAPA